MRALPKWKFLQTAKYVGKNIMAGEAIYPFYCSFKLTRRCNFTCSFCNCWMGQWPDLSTEEVCRVIDNIARSSIIVCSWEGGDPLVREDIGYLLRYQWTKPFYLLFTTSERNLGNYPMEEYGRYIDFLHISIDEGHENMDMYDELDEYCSWGPVVCIQVVVTKNDIDALEFKVKRAYEAGAKVVVMACAHLDKTEDVTPEFTALGHTALRLKQRYPNTIISPDHYFENILKPVGGCSSSSVIVDYDGNLFYPCRVLENKTLNLVQDDLMTYLESVEAHVKRQEMAVCTRQCGWYQYFATNSFVTPKQAIDALRPYVQDYLHPHFKDDNRSRRRLPVTVG